MDDLPQSAWPQRAAFALTSFFGALLLFMVQPMAAKQLLPVFGGSAGTWAACMLFFQVMLVCGYAYVHVTTWQLSARTQLHLQLLLLALAALTVAFAGQTDTPEAGSAWPPLRIAWLLGSRLGAPYFLLACTAPLLQRWAALRFGHEPYALYAWSNAGSLLALLSYPLLIEPALSLDQAFALWSRGFVAYALCLGCIGWLARPALVSMHWAGAPNPPAVSVRLGWLGYSFVPSALLLAVTQHVTVDIAATPLLWVVPLALYLLSFVIAFGHVPAWLRAAILPLWIAACVGLAWSSFAQGSAPLFRQLASALLTLFGAALFCHLELVQRRPAAEGLTRFYLYIAVGGALGGVFVSMVAPLLFSDYYELELSVLGSFLLLLTAARASRSVAWRINERRLLQLGAGVCVPLLLANIVIRVQGETRQGSVVERRRSFLGPLRVIQLPEGRVLTHGRIRHGMQLSDPGKRDQPTMYFGPGTALSQVLSRPTAAGRKIGVVGLGVGTLAAYGRAGDQFRFYELDENVEAIARRDFSFLRDSRAQVQVAIGDGRLLLAREPIQHFDVLVLDAFSSDSVPVHLLTREAFAVYLRQLAPDGVLLANVSNRHLAVDRVVRASAEVSGLACSVVQTDKDAAHFVSRVRWAIMARSPRLVHALLGDLPELAADAANVLWTDAHASLLPILR